MKATIAGFLILVYLGAISAGWAPKLMGQETNEQRAKQLWEQAIAAKGGRERLYTVQNLLTSYGGKHRTVALAVFPSKFWIWADDRPSPLGLSIEMHSLEAGTSYRVVNNDRKLVKTDDTRRGKDVLLHGQLLYLMETPWVKPVPYEAREDSFNGKPVDVVYARVGKWKISYTLDKKTHLPVAYTRHVWVEHRRLPTGHVIPAQETSRPIELADYIEVAGIQLPRMVRFDPKIQFIEYAYSINVEYNESLFNHPPSIEDGPEAWRPRATH